MRRRAWLAWGTIAVAFGSTVFACGLEDGGTLDGIDEHDGAVTTTDGALPDAGSGDAHVTPGDGSTPTDSGPGPDATVDSGPSPVGTFDCGGTKVVECRTDCPTAPIGCVGNSKCVSDCGGGSCAFTGFECSACANDGGTGTKA